MPSNWVKIFAPAGSGKTRELVRLAREHQQQDGLALREIAVVSFTRAAAREIGRRIAEGQSAQPEDLRWCRTIHSLAFALLELKRGQVAQRRLPEFFEAEKLPFAVEERTADEDEYLPEPNVGKLGNFILAFIEWQRNRCLPFDEAFRLYHVSRPELEDVWDRATIKGVADRYAGWKRACGLVDFTDMVERCLAERLAPPTRLLLGDEAQDQTTLQWRLFSFWAAQHEVVYVAGDDDQGIYGFIGTDPRDFLGFPAETYALDTNYRSRAGIVTAARRVIERNRLRMPKEMHTVRPGGVVTRIGWLPRLSPERSTFVLARNVYLLRPAIEELQLAGIPFACRRGSGGLTRSLRLGAFRAVQALRRGEHITGQQLHLIYQHIRGPEYVVRGWKKRVAGLAAEEERNPQGASLLRLDDLPSYGGTSVLQEAIRHDQPDLLGQIPEARLRYWRLVLERHGDAGLSDRPAIELGTIHSVKGLEADDVYLLSDVSPAVYDELLFDPEAERRVLYTAMTRAREGLYLVEPQTRRSFEELG